ncbi:MAG: hypothetical protein IKK74_09025 [Clostridia bacterium]|nr:hypothetical protein [Clostridia bacterium]
MDSEKLAGGEFRTCAVFALRQAREVHWHISIPTNHPASAKQMPFVLVGERAFGACGFGSPLRKRHSVAFLGRGLTLCSHTETSAHSIGGFYVANHPPIMSARFSSWLCHDFIFCYLKQVHQKTSSTIVSEFILVDPIRLFCGWDFFIFIVFQSEFMIE